MRGWSSASNRLRCWTPARRRRSCGGPRGRRSCSRLVGAVVARLAARLRALVGADAAYDAAHVAERLEVALERESIDGRLEAAVALLEDAPLLGDEGVEVVGRDELVLAPD